MYSPDACSSNDKNTDEVLIMKLISDLKAFILWFSVGPRVGPNITIIVIINYYFFIIIIIIIIFIIILVHCWSGSSISTCSAFLCSFCPFVIYKHIMGIVFESETIANNNNNNNNNNLIFILHKIRVNMIKC